jgi:hypothetical protein
MANNINELYDSLSDDPLFTENFKSADDLETYLKAPANVKDFRKVYGAELDETQLMGLKKKEDTSSSSSVSVGAEPMVETPQMGVQDNNPVLEVPSGAADQGIDLSGQPLPEMGYGKGIPLPDPAKQKYVDGELIKIQKFLESNNPGAAFAQLRQLKMQNPDLKLTPEQNATLTAPLNKFLESRKAQPGSASLIKTITKDASDLGLTLETVKPELTPQQKAVSAAVKQIPAEKLKPDTQPISEDVVGDMKEVESDFFNKLEANIYDIGAGIYRIPEFAYGLTKSMMTPEQRATIMLALEPTMKTIEENNIPAQVLEKKAQDMKSKMQVVEGTISDRFAEGDYANGFTMISNSIAESLPSTLMVVMTGGGSAGLGLMGLSTAVSKKKELDEMQKRGEIDIDEQDKYINAVATGTSEALFEAIGIGSIARVSKNIFAREGVDEGKEILRRGILDNFDNLIKKYPVLLGPLAEGMSEVATTIAQNAADKYTGVDPERDLFQGATDALIVGSAMGAGFGGALKIAQVVLPKPQRNKITENQQNIQRASELVQDPNITPEKKEALDNLAAQSSAENTKLEKEGLDKLSTIPEDKRMEFTQLSEKAANIEDQIDTEQDPLIKKALESELTTTQTKIKEIENAVQKQTTSEVPVQPETSVGQEMVEGEPQAEPQVAAQEGQKEEVTEEPKFSKGVEAPTEDVVKSKKNEDNDHTVTLNGEEVGMMYYDSSQKTWVNANFDRSSEKPYTSKWIYGDMLGDTKQEAIDELVRRYKENKPEVSQQENKVEYSKDETLNTFLNTLNNTNPLQSNPLRPGEFIYNNKAALEFNRFDKGNRKEVELQDISVVEKGKGEGKAVMKDITNAADKSGITLTLEAKPFGRGGLNKKDLIDFYKKNGFEVDWKDAYGGDFNSEQELIDYALENESEGVPMKRMPVQTAKFSKSEEGISVPQQITQPSNEQWSPSLTQSEVDAKLAEAGVRTKTENDKFLQDTGKGNETQRNNIKTYDTFVNGIVGKFGRETVSGMNILDAGAGLGIGAKAAKDAGIADSYKTFEPFASTGDGKWQKFSETETPDYTDFSKVKDNSQDVIVNNAVLNVVPSDIREGIVRDIARVMKPGAEAYISVRGIKESALQESLAAAKSGNSKNVYLSDTEYYVPGNQGDYQKGFSEPELQAYVQDVLGPDFKVEISKEAFWKSSPNAPKIVITKTGEGIAKTGDVDNSDIEAIREEMNNMPEEKANFDVPSDLSTKNKLDIKSIAPKLKAKLKGLFKGGIIKNLADWNGIPMTFTISDQLASEPVKNSLTGNTIDTNGGLLFSLTKGNESNAWANTDETEAKKMLSRAQEVYKKNKELYKRLWKEGRLPYGHIPMAIIKMGQDSILSNEALFRIGSDNIKTHFTAEERTNALESLKEDVSAVDPNAKVLEFIDQNKFTTIDQLLDKMAELKPIGERKIVSRFLFTGSVALDKETKPGKPQSKTGLALVGNKDASFYKYVHLQTLNNIIQEKATAKIPASHVIGIAGVDVLNPSLTKPKHSNYPDGVKGQLIGLVESPVHAADIFPEMYSKTFYLQKENKAGKATSPKAAVEQAVAPSGFVASIKAFRGAKISTKMTELQKLLGKLKLAFPSVTIVDSAQEFESALNNPDVKKFVKDGEVVYGFTKDGKVYLNPDKANANTAIHEFSHIWMNFLKQNNPALLKKGYDILEGTDLLKKKIKEFGNVELAREEAMAEAIANKGETLIEAGKQSKFKNWLNAVFSYVKEKFKAFDQYTAEELQDINLNQFIEGSLNAILGGKEVTAEDIKNFEVAFSKAAKPLDATQIKSEYDADIAAGNTATEAMKNLLAQGYSYNQIGDQLGRANIQEPYNAAIAEMGKEVAAKYSDTQEARLKEIESYLGDNPVPVEQLRSDLIGLGYADLEIFTAMNRNLFSQSELFKAFGETYRQTVQNAIADSRYPAQDLSEVSEDTRSIKVMQSVSDLTDNFVDFSFVDANVLVEHMVNTLKKTGLVEAANKLAEALKKKSVRKTLTEEGIRAGVERAGEYIEGDNVMNIPQTLLNFSELTSIAGRILVMARAAKKDMADLIIGSIERGPLKLSEVSKKKIKELVDDYNLKSDIFNESRQTFKQEKDDASFISMQNAEADLYQAGDKLMSLLESFKLRYWNDVLTSASTRSLVALQTVVVSGWGNFEQGVLGQLSSPVRASISKVSSASKKTNRLSYSDFKTAQSLAAKKSIAETWAILTKGKYTTPDMAQKYMDGIADVNAQKDYMDSIKFITDLIGVQSFQLMGSPYTHLDSFNDKQVGLTEEEFAANYDKLMYQTQNGDIKLLDGKSYTVASAMFRAVIGTIPEITGRMLAISGDRIAFHGYKTRALIDYIRTVEQEVKAGKRDTELQKYIAKELGGVVKSSDMDLLINLSIVLSDNSDFGKEEAMKRVFMNDNFATKLMGGTRKSIKKAITNLYFKSLTATSPTTKTFATLGKFGFQGLDVSVWTLSPFTRVPVNVLAAGMQNTLIPVSPFFAISSAIRLNKINAEFNKKYGSNLAATLKSDFAQTQYEKARQELFEVRRQHNYNLSAVVTSAAISYIVLEMALSGALTPPAGPEDEDRRKALNATNLRPSEINFTYLSEWLASSPKERERLMITRGWKPGDYVEGYQNFGLIGQTMGYFASNVYQFGKEKVKKNSYVENMKPSISATTAFFTLGESSIQNISALQNIGLFMDIPKAKDPKKAAEKLFANMLAATGAVAAPNTLNFFAKGQAQTQMSLGQVIPSQEEGGIIDLGPVGIQAAAKLSKNSQVFGVKSDYYQSGIGVFGEELKLNLTGMEPGTAGAYFSAMINPFGLRSFAQVKGKDAKADFANKINLTLTSMSMISDELGLLNEKGQPLNMWSALSINKDNSYEIGEGVNKVTLSLPFDLYRKELQILGNLRYNGMVVHIENFQNNLEQMRSDPNNDANIEKLARATFNTLNKVMTNTLSTYESELTSLRLRGILTEMDKRGLITAEDKKKIEIALPGQFIK